MNTPWLFVVMLDCPENLYTFTCPTVMILHVTVFTNIWRWYSVYIWRTYGPIFNNLLVINDVLPWWLSVSKYVCVMIWRDSTLGKGPLWPLCSLTTSQIWGYNSQVPPPVQVGVLVFAPGSADWLRRYNTTNDIWEILFSNLSSSVQHTHLTPLICLQPAAPGYFQTIHFQSEDHIRELRPPTHYRPDIKVTIYFCSLDRIIFPDRPAISSEVVKTLNSDEELLEFVLYWRLSQ